MDPLTLSASFATVVQLVGMYKQEHKEAKDVDDKNFMAWLEYHRHEEIKNLICNTAALQTEVVNLLRSDTTVILSKLDSINTTMAKLLSQVEGFKGISKILLPGAELSDQAVSVLRQLVNSGASNLTFAEFPDHFLLHPDGGESFEITEPLFLADDIDSLQKCGLLSPRRSADPQEQVLGITRAGAKYIELLDQNTGTG